jgi:putative tryptophan/tyrosine transport system substrate-binding protein
MRRRDFIAALGGAGPLMARAQQSSMSVIGYLGPGSAQSDAFRVTGFRQGLKEAGYVEGQNLTIEYRWAEDHRDRLPAMAADLLFRDAGVARTPSAKLAHVAHAEAPCPPVRQRFRSQRDQCAMKTGSVALAKMWRVAPPKINSLRRLCV